MAFDPFLRFLRSGGVRGARGGAMVVTTRRGHGDGPVRHPPEVDRGPTAPPDPAANLEQRKRAAKEEYDRHVREVKSREDARGEATTRHTEADGVYHAAVDANDAAEKKVMDMLRMYKTRYADPNTRAAKDYKRNLDRENVALKDLVQKRNSAWHVRVTLSRAKKTKEDEVKEAKAALRAAKDTYEAFFGKSESTEACPACSHNYTVRNGSHRVRGVSVPVGQFMCQCFKYAKNCKQCPVCSLTMDPNAPFSLETTNACQCPICKYVTPLFPSRDDGDSDGDGDGANSRWSLTLFFSRSCKCLCKSWHATPESRENARHKALTFKAANERAIELSGTEGVTRLRNAVGEEIELTDTRLQGFANVPAPIAAALTANDATMARVGGLFNRPRAQIAIAQPSADMLRRGVDRVSEAGWRPVSENESSFSGMPGPGGDDARRGQSKGKPRGAAAASNRDRSESAGKRLAAEAAGFHRAGEAARRVGQDNAGPSRLNPNVPTRQPPPPRRFDPAHQPPHEDEVITVEDEDDAEKNTRDGREQTVQVLKTLYTNMTDIEVRPPPLFHASSGSASQVALFADGSRRVRN